MTRTPFFLASLLLPLLACRGSVDLPPGEALSVEEACHRVLDASEQRGVRCGAGAWSDDVRSAVTSACVAVGKAPGVEVDASRVGACVETVPSTMCLDDLPADCGQGGPDGFLRGTVAPGDECYLTEQCAEGYCGATAGASCGWCVIQVGPGEACDGKGVECVFGYTCASGACAPVGTPPGGACTSYGGLNDCIDGYYCKPNDPGGGGIDGTCSPRPETGGACGFVPCLSTDACVNDVCATIVHVAPGAACDLARLCDAPAVCFEGTCNAPSEHVTVGGACNEQHNRCVPGLLCDDGTCKEPSTAVGDGCPCAPGLSCVDGACQEQKVGMTCHGLLGAPCGPDLYCKGWTGVSAGTCIPRVKPGESCASATQMELYGVCFGPYVCGDSGVCELIAFACQ